MRPTLRCGVLTRIMPGMAVVVLAVACDRGAVSDVADGESGRRPPVVVVPLHAGPPPDLVGTIAFHSDREGRNRIFALDLPDGRVRRVTSGRDHHDEEPAWSPTGQQLAFVTTRFDATSYDVAVSDASGGQVRRITAGPGVERAPAWAPDAQSILFQGTDAGLQRCSVSTSMRSTCGRSRHL